MWPEFDKYAAISCNSGVISAAAGGFAYGCTYFSKGSAIVAMKESGQMYLETILVLSKKSSAVRAIDVAEHMNYSKPSVSRALHILSNNGFVEIDKNGYITLNPSGRSIAENILERHETITRLLVSIGVSEKTAVEDACRVEHYISDETFEAIKRSIGRGASRAK